MRMRFILALLAAALGVVARAADFPRTAAGKPDLTGFWNIPYTPNMAKEIGELPFSPEGKAAFAKVANAYDPTGFCLYPGVPRIVNSPFPMEIMQTSERIAFLYEYMTTFRSISTGGRAHSKDPEATFMGESVGSWDGDALIIDTIGLNERTWLDTAGHQHSDALHVIERYQMADANHIRLDITVDDPKMYTKPWSNHRVLERLKPGEHLLEYSCDENNLDRDKGHLRPGSNVVPSAP